MVEIYDSENSDSEKECVSLNGIWTVQDRESQNKKRFAFEVTVIFFTDCQGFKIVNF